MDFCKRMESTETANVTKPLENDGVARKVKGKPEPKKAKQPRKRWKEEDGSNLKFYCMVHGTNDSHASDNGFPSRKW